LYSLLRVGDCSQRHFLVESPTANKIISELHFNQYSHSHTKSKPGEAHRRDCGQRRSDNGTSREIKKVLPFNILQEFAGDTSTTLWSCTFRRDPASGVQWSRRARQTDLTSSPRDETAVPVSEAVNVPEHLADFLLQLPNFGIQCSVRFNPSSHLFFPPSSSQFPAPASQLSLSVAPFALQSP
jgi:hypothetical protein